jgi:transcriptional regulator with XRE-family HTH domain
MAADHPRTRLEQRLQAARLTQREVLRRFPDEAVRLGEAGVAVSQSQLKRWLSGEAAIPRAAACRVLEGWLGESVERLFGPPDEIVTGGEREDTVAEAGKRSVEHAIDAASALDPSALEHLQAAAERAAHTYLTTPPLTMLQELVQLRDTAYDQLERTHKPRQQADLYLLAGLCCGLLSSVSLDLGHPDVANDQARAAHTYGSVIDHPSLCAWARGLQATVILWSGQPRRVLTLTESGLHTAPIGSAQVRLYSVRARALSLIGAREEVDASLAAAADQLDDAGADAFLDGIGGELAFDRSRHALCASSSYLGLHDGPRAESAAEHALYIFAELPASDRWASGVMSAAVDLGTARAIRGDLAGCESAVGDVFSLPAGERTESVTQRLIALGRLVSAPRFRRSIEAQRLGASIEEFTATSLARTTSRPAIGPA